MLHTEEYFCCIAPVLSVRQKFVDHLTKLKPYRPYMKVRIYYGKFCMAKISHSVNA